MNSGNLVNRIGLQRRYRNIAISVAVVAIGVAVAGWSRPVRIISYSNNNDIFDSIDRINSGLKNGEGNTKVPYCVKYETIEGKDYCFATEMPISGCMEYAKIMCNEEK